ncbi:MAG: phosphate signaling complex protein PhoU [Gammaproteobacteria bacterium]|jgi:phosphate transport system protein|nr:phosphate signaling complex protein PhoU [Gammaproteobacteria bacterium]
MSEANEGHTVKRYDAELARLRELVLEMGGLVISQTEKAVRALRKQDLDEARLVEKREPTVNEYDLLAEKEMNRIIALRQPVAGDLRLIIGVSKSISDLERIGDEALKIARIAIRLYDSDESSPNKKLLRDVKIMCGIATEMLRSALDAFDTMDMERAIEIAKEDDELDNEFQSATRRLTTYVMEDSRNMGHAMNILLVVKALERIGDHAKNIAEYVVFLVKGRDVRHVASDRIEAESLRET